MKSSSIHSTIADRMVPLTSIGLLPVCWVLAIAGLLGIAVSFHGKSEFFYGIVGTREQVISFQYPVEVVQIHAVEGKGVTEGQAILEVRRHDLAVGQETLEERIRRLDLEKKETTLTLGSQVRNLSAKRDAALADLDGQIHALERKLRALQSVSGPELRANAGTDANALELADLRQKRRFTDLAINAEINNLKSQLGGASRPIDAQIAELQKTKTETQRQVDAMKVGALFDGKVSSINFRAGELVPAFQPIVTVQGMAPRDIKGYVHENVLNDVRMGQTVWVRPIVAGRAQAALEATVEGLGNRIVEYPLRLRRNQAVTAFGREVVVKLKNESNPLLFGEKVEVALAQKREWPSLLSNAQAKAATPAPALTSPNDGVQVLTSVNAQIQGSEIEASGLWWNATQSHYLMVSDESHGRGAAIFVVNPDMRIEAQLKMQPGTVIDDLESISSDGDHVYVLSSLSHNKHDKLKDVRKKLLRFRYQGNHVQTQEEVDLHAVLQRLAQESSTSPLSRFLAAALRDKSLNIESHAVRAGKLIIGFKSPQAAQGVTVMAEINNLNALFAGQMVSAKIWAQVALFDPLSPNTASRLSDMAWVGDQLFVLTVSSGSAKHSQLWRMNAQGIEPVLLKRFAGLAAEGLAYRPDTGTLTVVFDEGKGAPSKHQTLRVSQLKTAPASAPAAPPAAGAVTP
jgi:multidrug resistance efflux pump